MARLHEYQGKAILAANGFKILRSVLAHRRHSNAVPLHGVTNRMGILFLPEDFLLVGQNFLLIAQNAVEFALVRFDLLLVAQDFLLVTKDPLLVGKQFIVCHRLVIILKTP